MTKLSINAEVERLTQVIEKLRLRGDRAKAQLREALKEQLANMRKEVADEKDQRSDQGREVHHRD